MNMSYFKLNVDCWSYHTAAAITARGVPLLCSEALLKTSKSPPPCHVPVTLPREMCTECFERLVSNILQGDKMLHFLYFV